MTKKTPKKATERRSFLQKPLMALKVLILEKLSLPVILDLAKRLCVDANAIGSTKCRPSLGSTERLPKGRYLDRLKDSIASELDGKTNTKEDVRKISFDESQLGLQLSAW